MKNTIKKTGQQTPLRRLAKLTISIIFSILLVICSTRIVLAIRLQSITVSGTNGDINVVDNQFNGTTISPTLVFNTVNDSITYNIPLSSPDGTEYQISNVSDDNTNPYITTTYSYDDDMNADNKSIYATMAYTDYLPENETLSLNDIHISVAIDENVAPQDPSDPTPDDPSDPSDPTPDDPSNPSDPNDPSNPTDQPNHESNNNDDTGSQISAPNTGKYFRQKDNSQPDDVIPYLILGFLSIIILVITILPKKNRIKFGTPIIVLSLSVINLALPHNTHAETANYELTILGRNISAIPEVVTPPQNAVSFYFPNIYNNPNLINLDPADSSTYGAGNAIIMETLDNKYVLLDTGEAIGTGDKTTKDALYNKLKELQNNNKVTLDYLIISHLDHDHYSSAVDLLNDENITIHNIIFKYERYTGAGGGWMDSTRLETFRSLVAAAANNNTNIITNTNASATIAEITSTTFDSISEGMTIQIGNYLKLDFFNTSNVYDGRDCLTSQQIHWKATRNPDLPFRTSDGDYIYFDGDDENMTLKTTRDFEQSGTGANRRFYAIDRTNDVDPTTGENILQTGNICRSNPNSFGILAEVLLDDSNTRYAYFANDLENAGYDTREGGFNSARLFDNDRSKIKLSNDGDLTGDITPYLIPSETNVARSIRTKLGNAVSNIDIYQMSHHGLNNNREAIELLHLNRENGIFAIEENHAEMSTANSWSYINVYYYTLGKIPAERKMKVGTADKNGVKCDVNTQDGTTCEFY